MKTKISLYLIACFGLLTHLVIDPCQSHVRLGISRLESRSLFQLFESSFQLM